MTLAVVLALIAAGCCVLASGLMRQQWPHRAPSAAIALWQAIGAARVVAMIGAALAAGLAPYERGVALGLVSLTRQGPASLSIPRQAALAGGLLVAGVLLLALALSAVEAFVARRRHRFLLALVARGDPSVPEALVLDHPAAAAYCVPGVRSRIVVSAGAMRLLGRGELAAVLAHERAHARERHDLVLLPFTALRRTLFWVRRVREAIAAVHLLVEMRADDRARREHPPRMLASALVRFGTARVGAAPCGALSIAEQQADQHVTARVRRLLEPPPGLPRVARVAVLAGSVALVALPGTLLVLPGP